MGNDPSKMCGAGFCDGSEVRTTARMTKDEQADDAFGQAPRQSPRTSHGFAQAKNASTRFNNDMVQQRLDEFGPFNEIDYEIVNLIKQQGIMTENKGTQQLQDGMKYTGQWIQGSEIRCGRGV